MKLKLIILSLLFASTTLSISGQSNSKTRTVIINSGNELIEPKVLIENYDFKVKNNRSYTSYFKEKLLQTQGGYSGHLLHGICSFYYLSDRLKKQGYFKLGLKTGEWKHWNEKGTLTKIEFWQNGKKSGSFKEFDEEGNLLKKGTYKNGKLHGTLTHYEFGEPIDKEFYKNGEQTSKKRFWDAWF